MKALALLVAVSFFCFKGLSWWNFWEKESCVELYDSKFYKQATKERVQSFIDKGCDLNKESEDGETPIFALVRSLGASKEESGKIDALFEFFLENEANIYHRAKGNTLLHYAIFYDMDLDFIKTLVEDHNIDINAQNEVKYREYIRDKSSSPSPKDEKGYLFRFQVSSSGVLSIGTSPNMRNSFYEIKPGLRAIDYITPYIYKLPQETSEVENPRKICEVYSYLLKKGSQESEIGVKRSPRGTRPLLHTEEDIEDFFSGSYLKAIHAEKTFSICALQERGATEVSSK